MTIIQIISGRAIPLLGNDIDTDRIIPARFLRCVTFDGLGEQAFKDDRAQLQGQHPLDLPQYQGATILIVNGNFGCGSSREHAPQALAKWGIKALIGESFAEIFFGNCLAIGMPCVTATAAQVEQLQTKVATQPHQELTLALQALTIQLASQTMAVQMPRGAQQMLLSGTWDSCAQLMSDRSSIRATAQQLPYLVW